MAKLVTKTYADALFQLAVEENRVDELYSEVETLLGILDANPELAKVMSHPSVDKNEKLSVIKNIFTGKVSAEVCGLLYQIVEKGRYEEIDGILACFIDEVKEYKKIGVAQVVTPTALTDAQKKRIEQKLIDTTDYVKMEIDYRIDESLIGGMRIRIGDKVIDSSISTKINELAKNLRRIQISTV